MQLCEDDLRYFSLVPLFYFILFLFFTFYLFSSPSPPPPPSSSYRLWEGLRRSESDEGGRS